MLPADLQAQNALAELRKEADGLKQCFTNFSFQAIAFGSVGLGAILEYGRENVWVNGAAALVAVLAIGTARIGVHKYATANRIYGFQLFVERLSGMPPDELARLTDASLDIGWEEAMKAWRIVQASVFEALYEGVGEFPMNRPTGRNTAALDQGAWWDVESLIKAQWSKDEAARKSQRKKQETPRLVVYHAGSYLSTMLTGLYAFAIVSLLLFIVGFCRMAPRDSVLLFARGSTATADWFLPVAWTLGLMAVCCFCWHCICHLRFIDRRRRLLESGLLSIHGCAIMWEAVVVAHVRAMDKLTGHLNGYTENLYREVKSLLEKPGALENIHDWFKPVDPADSIPPNATPAPPENPAM